MDGLYILGNILTQIAVTSCSATDEFTVYILKRNGKTVDLRLNTKACIGVAFANLVDKLVKLLQGKNILQTHQRHRVLHLFKFAKRRAANPFCRGIITGKLRIIPFQIL